MKKIIKGAKLTDVRTLSPSYLEILDDQTERFHKNISCDQLVHDDLIKTFAKLKSHLVIICEERESDGLEPRKFDPELQLTNYKVTGFTIGGEDDHQGVTLIGQKELSNGKILNLISPFTKYSDENDKYEYGHDLAIDIQACVYEIEQYLFNGKYAIREPELPFGDKNPDGVEVDINASEVAGAVLGHLADSILGEKPKKNKGKGTGKKGKVVDMLSTENVEVSIL